MLTFIAYKMSSLFTDLPMKGCKFSCSCCLMMLFEDSVKLPRTFAKGIFTTTRGSTTPTVRFLLHMKKLKYIFKNIMQYICMYVLLTMVCSRYQFEVIGLFAAVAAEFPFAESVVFEIAEWGVDHFEALVWSQPQLFYRLPHKWLSYSGHRNHQGNKTNNPIRTLLHIYILGVIINQLSI